MLRSIYSGTMGYDYGHIHVPQERDWLRAAAEGGLFRSPQVELDPLALDGQVVIRPMMYMVLNYDHRMMDGSEAVLFLVRIKKITEAPETLLPELQAGCAENRRPAGRWQSR